MKTSKSTKKGILSDNKQKYKNIRTLNRHLKHQRHLLEPYEKKQNLKNQPYDYYVILDFEATCDVNNRGMKTQEIIEFPSVLLDAKKNEIINEFQAYLKPVHEPILSDFCIQLTGIQQSWVDEGYLFPVALENYQNWLISNGLHLEEKNFTIITCGDWDLKTMLPLQCDLVHSSVPSFFQTWINIKRVFSNFYGSKMGSMEYMLQYLGLPLEGRHHSGIDDCKNITSIVMKMLEEGVILEETSCS